MLPDFLASAAQEDPNVLEESPLLPSFVALMYPWRQADTERSDIEIREQMDLDTFPDPSLVWLRVSNQRLQKVALADCLATGAPEAKAIVEKLLKVKSGSCEQKPDCLGLVAIGTLIEPVSVTGVAANVSPMASPPFGSEPEGASVRFQVEMAPFSSPACLSSVNIACASGPLLWIKRD